MLKGLPNCSRTLENCMSASSHCPGPPITFLRGLSITEYLSTGIQFHSLPFVKFPLLKREWRPFILRVFFEGRLGMFQCTWGAITGIG